MDHSHFYEMLSTTITKDQENPELCASGTFGSFTYNPVDDPGRFVKCPVGTESCVKGSFID